MNPSTSSIEEYAPSARAQSGGPLLAIAGLCGGAGASTLAYLIARASAEASAERVLACDLGGPTAGLAVCAEAATPYSLAGLAARVGGAGGPADGLFAELAGGLRLIASGPEIRDSEPPADSLEDLLDDARAAHGLTVLDCGLPASSLATRALSRATHVAWVLPASAKGLGRCAPLLRQLEFRGTGSELVVARAVAGAGRAPMAELTALADERDAPLILLPELGEEVAKRWGTAHELARPALDAIAGELDRGRSRAVGEPA